MLRLDVLAGDRARLSFPKIRWSRRGRRPALILAFDSTTESYTVVGEEGEERDYVAEIAALLADGVWRITKEIAAPKKPKKDRDKPGVGANVDTVKATLEQNPELFESRTGKAAVALGRSARATVWQLRTQGPESVESVEGFSGGETDYGLTDSTVYRDRESGVRTSPPREQTQKPESVAADDDQLELDREDPA
jgi:hypothetical protein